MNSASKENPGPSQMTEKKKKKKVFSIEFEKEDTLDNIQGPFSEQLQI